mmetsp:Transcript_69206/g.202652  ORF Transcript_69206/g.202652 Transcript_69206/m.202652 type:complete len:258 (+) Transcript_69206:66-839(+)
MALITPRTHADISGGLETPSRSDALYIGSASRHSDSDDLPLSPEWYRMSTDEFRELRGKAQRLADEEAEARLMEEQAPLEEEERRKSPMKIKVNGMLGLAKPKAEDTTTSTTDPVHKPKVIVDLARKPAVRVTAVCAATGMVAGGVVGAGNGIVVGGAAGAAVGSIPALLTLGLSIPIGAMIGSGVGLCAGSVIGGSVGAVGGGAVGYSGYSYRQEIGETKQKVWTSVVKSADDVVARARNSKEYVLALVSGTGGTA